MKCERTWCSIICVAMAVVVHDCSMFHEVVGPGMLQTLGGPGPVGVAQMVVHFCLQGLQSLAGGSFTQEVAWEVVPLPYSSIWERSQDVVPRLSRKCTLRLECMSSREFGAVAGSDVLEGRCWWGQQGCDNIRAVVIVKLVDKAQGSNSSANLHDGQICSVSDDV